MARGDRPRGGGRQADAVFPQGTFRRRTAPLPRGGAVQSSFARASRGSRSWRCAAITTRQALTSTGCREAALCFLPRQSFWGSAQARRTSNSILFSGSFCSRSCWIDPTRSIASRMRSRAAFKTRRGTTHSPSSCDSISLELVEPRSLGFQAACPERPAWQHLTAFANSMFREQRPSPSIRVVLPKRHFVTGTSTSPSTSSNQRVQPSP